MEQPAKAFHVIKYCEIGLRPQCLVYDRASSRHLQLVAPVLGAMLELNYRYLNLNSPPMGPACAHIWPQRALNIAREVAIVSLALSSEQQHLRGGYFDADAMMQTLANDLEQALHDDYAGLWASGDMAWEFGPRKDFTRLLE